MMTTTSDEHKAQLMRWQMRVRKVASEVLHFFERGPQNSPELQRFREKKNRGSQNAGHLIVNYGCGSHKSRNPCALTACVGFIGNCGAA